MKHYKSKKLLNTKKYKSSASVKNHSSSSPKPKCRIHYTYFSLFLMYGSELGAIIYIFIYIFLGNDDFIENNHK